MLQDTTRPTSASVTVSDSLVAAIDGVRDAIDGGWLDLLATGSAALAALAALAAIGVAGRQATREHQERQYNRWLGDPADQALREFESAVEGGLEDMISGKFGALDDPSELVPLIQREVARLSAAVLAGVEALGLREGVRGQIVTAVQAVEDRLLADLSRYASNRDEAPDFSSTLSRFRGAIGKIVVQENPGAARTFLGRKQHR